MNQYLKAAVKRYESLLTKNKKEKGGFLINPISEIDAEIIIELSELLRKSGNSEAVSILKEYKGLRKDLEIRDQLIDCNLNTKDIELDEYGNEDFADGEGGENSGKSVKHLINTINKLKKLLENKREFIVIGEERIQANLIFGYQLKDLSNADNEQYKIILNPIRVDATKIPLYSNKEFIFYDYGECVCVMETIDKQLEEAKVKFVNKGKNMEENGD